MMIKSHLIINGHYYRLNTYEVIDRDTANVSSSTTDGSSFDIVLSNTDRGVEVRNRKYLKIDIPDIPEIKNVKKKEKISNKSSKSDDFHLLLPYYIIYTKEILRRSGFIGTTSTTVPS